MKVACLLKDSKLIMICEESEINKHHDIKRVLTKKQFFNHHYPKYKHYSGVKEVAKTLYI